MKLKTGSRVKFLNEKGGGIIIGFRDDTTAMVQTSDGFEMPIQVTELIPDEIATYEIKNKNTGEQNKNESNQKKKAPVTYEEKKYLRHQGTLLLALVPENEQILHVSNFGLYVINTSNYLCLYLIGYRENEIFTYIKAGSLEPGSKKVIAKYGQTEIAKIKEFRVQALFYKYGLMDFSKALDLSFNMEGISFYKINFFKENEFFKSKAILLKEEEIDFKTVVNKLSEGDFAKVIRSKEAIEKKTLVKPKDQISKTEIDLHIEEIIDNHSALSNGEIIEIQLGRFETALETALLSNENKIIFIHGVGNGVLKNELRNKLDKKYPTLRYQDASFKEYGYGATLVYLK